MIGGMNWPPVEAEASTAPANSFLYPIFFIIGIVKAPVVTVLATDEPEMQPSKPEETMATFAGPPADQPARAWRCR